MRRSYARRHISICLMGLALWGTMMDYILLCLVQCSACRVKRNTADLQAALLAQVIGVQKHVYLLVGAGRHV